MFKRKRKSQFRSRDASWRVKNKRSPLLRWKQLLRGKILIVLLVILLVSALIYGLFFTPVLLITTVEATTEYKDIKTESVESFMSAALMNKNTLFVNLGELETSIYDEFPEISSVDCRRNLFHQSVSCNALGFELVAVIKHEGQRYYINENGIIIEFDSRKLGLPIFDLILNPIFSNEKGVELTPSPETTAEPVLEPVAPTPAELSPTGNILKAREEGTLGKPLPTEAELPPEEPAQPLPDAGERISFIQPDEIFLIQAQEIINEPHRNPFTVEIGKKILDSKELKTILESIGTLEKDFQRKVTNVQYVQVASELSLKSTPAPKAPETPNSPTEEDQGEEVQVNEEEPAVDEPAPDSPPDTLEAPDHELEILLDLRRDLSKQFKKLQKTREVINFAEIQRIDLSVEGDKVFYR